MGVFVHNTQSAEFTKQNWRISGVTSIILAYPNNTTPPQCSINPSEPSLGHSLSTPCLSWLFCCHIIKTFIFNTPYWVGVKPTSEVYLTAAMAGQHTTGLMRYNEAAAGGQGQ